MNLERSLIAFQNVSYTYPAGEKPVMEGLNLDINAGTITAVLGPNGAGKTTLLHLALGWLHPSPGQVELYGEPLKNFSRRELGKWIGLVPQSENTPFEYSLLEYVLLGRTPYLAPLAMPEEPDVAIAAEKLDEVGLKGLHSRTMTSISGGERQLVLIARALTQQPKILLLDEPTSHLDLNNKGRLVQLLRQLQARGVTIIFTTHEPDVASALATHMVLMRKGEILKTGTSSEVMTGENLSALYNMPIQVKKLDGKHVVIWDEKVK
jgi:iron complex transport system ATP-binding protein